MRIDTAGAVALLLAIVPAYAQTDAAAAPTSPDRTYRLLRENEDWSFLKDPILRKDFWDPMKYIPLRANDWYVTGRRRNPGSPGGPVADRSTRLSAGRLRDLIR